MRFDQCRVVIALVLFIPATCKIAGAQIPTARTAQDTLPLQHGLVNGRLLVNSGELRGIQIASPFRYVGGSRFILGEAADAEQHLFVTADSNQTIQQVFWVQIEHLLPTRQGSYNYGADSAVELNGFKLFANATTYTTAPAASSDRARAFASLLSAGYRLPERATRLRLIFLPEQPARREVMIIYIEAAPQTAMAEPDSLLARAKRSIILERRQ